MLNNTMQQLSELKLWGMRNAYQTAIETRQQLTADELLNYLIQAEWETRQNSIHQRRLHQAQFRYQAHISEIDFSAARTLDKNTIMRLAECNFIKNGENIIITGPTGAGKSFVASAIGHQACLKGSKTLYSNTARLLSQLHIRKADNSYPREIAKLAKYELLILDDFGLQPFDNVTRLILLDLLEDRHSRYSTIIATQLPVGSWHDIIGDQTIADAILDRLVHNAYRIDLQGESMRRKKKLTSIDEK